MHVGDLTEKNITSQVKSDNRYDLIQRPGRLFTFGSSREGTYTE